jgi:predicted Zn-dependent peptidase
MTRRNAGALGLVWVLSAIPAFRLSAQDSFPTRPPAPTALRPVRFPPFQEVVLANGITLVVVENHEQPVLSATLSFRAGGIYEPAHKEGLAALTAELLTKGTTTRTAEQIAAQIEGAGGSIAADAGDDFFTLSTDVLSDHADLAFDLLGDVVRHSLYPADELELARTRSLSALSLELSQPSSVAARFFGREIYGRNPYGRTATPESLKGITRDDVVAFAAARLRPSGALLVVSGDATLAQAQAMAAKAFAGWRGAPAAAAPAPAPPVRTSTDILLVHRPGSVQSNIVVGNTTFLPSDPGYYPARLAMQVLGGGADARLFLILREQKSWTYGSYAGLNRNRGLGYWQATFEGRTEVTDSALRELLHQIDRVRTETIADSELTNAKNFLVGSFPLTIETPQQIASVVTTSKLLGLGPDYLRLYRERLAAVTPLAAKAAAARTIHRGALTIVVVGDGEKLYDKLKAIAPVRMVDVDGNPLTLEDLHPRGGPVAFDRSQLVAHRDSFTVLANGQPVGAMVTSLATDGDSVVYTEATDLSMVGFQQQTLAVLDGQSLMARRVDQTGSIQGQKAETHLTYAAGRVKGRVATPQPGAAPKTADIDTTVAAGTIDDNVVNALLPALPLTSGKSVNVSVFTSSDGMTKVLTVKVGAVEQIVVPAGTFSAYRLDVSGGQAPLAIYVSTVAPRRVVKLEIVGTPLQFVLAK